MGRVELAVDPELDALFPGRRAARVYLETYSGRAQEYLQPTRKGDPEQPLSDNDLGDKFLELAAPVVGTMRAKALLQRLWALENTATVSTLME